jgi:hypothetical protein
LQYRLLSGNSPLGKNTLEGGYCRVSASISAEAHRSCGEISRWDAADFFVAANNIAEHLVRDHPERFGKDLPRIQRDVQNVIDNATRTHTVQNGPQAGSQFFYRNGKNVVVRPNGQGTMVLDPGGAQFGRWVIQEP